MCALFRPFVEYGRRKQRARTGFQSSDEADESVSSGEDGVILDDPFDGVSVSGDFEKEGLTIKDAEPPILRTSSTTYYTAEDERYYWIDEANDGRNDIRSDELDEVLEREEAEDRAAGLLPQEERNSDDYDIVQWLCHNEEKVLGPEQLWLSAHTFYGDEDDLKGHQEISSVVVLSAGSVEKAEDGTSFCLDGRKLGGKHDLAFRVPSLFKWPLVKLTLPGKSSEAHMSPTFEFFQHRDRVKILSPPISSLSVPEDPCLSSCWRTMENWMTLCTWTHNKCESKISGKPPTRLIDVGLLDGSYHPQLHISEPGLEVQYTTLSHCWGGQIHSSGVLRTDNLDRLKRGIDMATLPRNFQDAIAITQKLRIPYLWIDSLCIIQDSVDDWAKESAQIAIYYERSHVMLSALAALESSRGILKRRLADIDAILVNFEDNELGFRLVLEDVKGVLNEIYHSSEVRPEIVQRPLNSRGWALQERLFATRIIHFTQQQLVWQCRMCLASEDGQFKMRKGTTSLGRGEKTTMDGLPFDLLDLSPERVHRKTKGAASRRTKVHETGWYDLVHTFSKRKLTFVTDLLPAVAGLARSVSEATGARYVAGLWTSQAKELLLNSLLWKPDKIDGQPVRPSDNGSPSWSWASLVAKIETTIYEDQPLTRNSDTHCDVVSIEATPATANPYGQVNGGTIGLHGYLHSLDRGPRTFADLRARRYRPHQLREDDRAERAEVGTSTAGQVTLNADSWRFWAVDEPPLHVAHGAGDYSALELDHTIDLPEKPPDWASGKIWLLLLGTWTPDGKEKWQHFMMLEEAADCPEDYYRRIGLAETEFEEDQLLITEEEGWARKTVFIV